MQANLVGVMDVNFTNNNGESIHETNIFVPFKYENVEGLCTESFSLKKVYLYPEIRSSMILLTFHSITKAKLK